MERSTVKLIFEKVMDGVKPNDIEVNYLEKWLLCYEHPKSAVIDPEVAELPVISHKSLIADSSRKYVELEKNGFLLSRLSDYKFNEKSYLYSLIFDGVRKNGFKWGKQDGWRSEEGTKEVFIRGYDNESVGPGLALSDPKDLNDADSRETTFTKMAEQTARRHDLPKFSASKLPDAGKFFLDFHNRIVKQKAIPKVPYLILNYPGLVDEKKKGIMPMSTFDFRKIEGKLKTLGFDKFAGFSHPYVYYYMHCSVAGFHDEDYSSNSLNVNYGPGSKLWQVVTREFAHKLRELNKRLKDVFGDERDVTLCNLQHKDKYKQQTLIHPGLLDLAGIPYKIVVQRPGVAILTASAAMHAVINYGTGVSVAINLIIPINYLMNPITDLCTHGYEEEEILIGLKKLALREVAENFPLETMPKTGDLLDIPTGDICGTRYFIADLIRDFERLAKPSTTDSEVRYEYANYALKRLVKLAGLHVTFDIIQKSSSSLNFTFSAKEVLDTPFPECPTDLADFVTCPVLVANFDEFGEILYCDGIVESVVAGRSHDPEEPARKNLVRIRKYDGSNVVIDILVRKDICKVISNRIPLQNELAVGDRVAYWVGNYYKVGVLKDIKANNLQPYRIQIPGGELHLRKHALRVMKPDWYGSLCEANHRTMIPLCLPEQPPTRTKRPLTHPESEAESAENPTKRFKFTAGEQVPFVTRKVNGVSKCICPKCNAEFTLNHSLIEHFHSVHVDGFKRFDCHVCHKHFSYRKTLDVHFKAKHNELLSEQPKIRLPASPDNVIIIQLE